MDLWYSEFHSKDVKLSIKVKKQVYSRKSKYQEIDIFDSYEFGRFLTLDGFMMLTEKDEFIYHEMITHGALLLKPSIKKVLIIGAGDGGVLRELVKYDTIETLDLVEIDEEVIKASKEFLKFTSIGFEDERVNVYIQDGLKYIRKFDDYYDLIIVDSTDPFGPGEGLFTKEFYGNCYNALKSDGILLNQHESPFYDDDKKAMKRAHKRINSTFELSKVYQAFIPTYPSGHWLFGLASKNEKLFDNIDIESWNEKNIDCKYFNAELFLSSFNLPNYVKEELDNE